MKIGDAVRATSVIAILLIPPIFSSAQDKSIGDVAREAHAEKSEARHAKKIVTDDDLGPNRGPVTETDDPVTVVREAWRAFLADAWHTCRMEETNDSGTGSIIQSLIEVQGRDRLHMVINRQGGPQPGRLEIIFVGKDIYNRNASGHWEKYTTTTGALRRSPFDNLLEIVDDGRLKLVRRETIDGSPSFVYENKYHPGGVSMRDTTVDIWIGANNHRIHKAQTLNSETLSLNTAPLVNRDTTTCSYGSMPQIEPPI